MLRAPTKFRKGVKKTKTITAGTTKVPADLVAKGDKENSRRATNQIKSEAVKPQKSGKDKSDFLATATFEIVPSSLHSITLSVSSSASPNPSTRNDVKKRRRMSLIRAPSDCSLPAKKSKQSELKTQRRRSLVPSLPKFVRPDKYKKQQRDAAVPKSIVATEISSPPLSSISGNNCKAAPTSEGGSKNRAHSGNADPKERGEKQRKQEEPLQEVAETRQEVLASVDKKETEGNERALTASLMVASEKEHKLEKENLELQREKIELEQGLSKEREEKKSLESQLEESITRALEAEAKLETEKARNQVLVDKIAKLRRRQTNKRATSAAPATASTTVVESDMTGANGKGKGKGNGRGKGEKEKYVLPKKRKAVSQKMRGEEQVQLRKNASGSTTDDLAVFQPSNVKLLRSPPAGKGVHVAKKQQEQSEKTQAGSPDFLNSQNPFLPSGKRVLRSPVPQRRMDACKSNT